MILPVLPTVKALAHWGITESCLLGPAISNHTCFLSITAWGRTVGLWYHWIQFLHRWHSVLGSTFFSWQWCVPPPDCKFEQVQRPAMSWWFLQPWGGSWGSREWEWACWLRWDGRGGDGQHHWSACELLCPEELYALSVPFPEAQLGSWEERSQWRRNEPPEVRWQAVCLVSQCLLAFDLVVLLVKDFRRHHGIEERI